MNDKLNMPSPSRHPHARLEARFILTIGLSFLSLATIYLLFI